MAGQPLSPRRATPAGTGHRHLDVAVMPSTYRLRPFPASVTPNRTTVSAQQPPGSAVGLNPAFLTREELDHRANEHERHPGRLECLRHRRREDRRGCRGRPELRPRTEGSLLPEGHLHPGLIRLEHRRERPERHHQRLEVRGRVHGLGRRADRRWRRLEHVDGRIIDGQRGRCRADHVDGHHGHDVDGYLDGHVSDDGRARSRSRCARSGCRPRPASARPARSRSARMSSSSRSRSRSR